MKSSEDIKIFNQSKTFLFEKRLFWKKLLFEKNFFQEKLFFWCPKVPAYKRQRTKVMSKHFHTLDRR